MTRRSENGQAVIDALLLLVFLILIPLFLIFRFDNRLRRLSAWTADRIVRVSRPAPGGPAPKKSAAPVPVKATASAPAQVPAPAPVKPEPPAPAKASAPKKSAAGEPPRQSVPAGKSGLPTR